MIVYPLHPFCTIIMNNKKHLCLLSGILLVVTLILSVMVSDQRRSAPFSCALGSDTEEQTEEILIWESEYGEKFIFLPSYADLSRLIFHTATDNISINGLPVIEGMSANCFTPNCSYELKYTVWGKEVCERITFLQSSNTSTMHIETESGNMNQIHAKKGNKENGTIRVYSPEGELEFDGNVKSLQGRGNTSWAGFEKKPYNLELENEANLLNMGVASNWVLLANAGDPSQIRNKIIYDFAGEIGLKYSPKADWVDLYLNGEYAGLYLLCEKNEIHPNRVDISSVTGVLVSKENPSHLMSKNVPKVTTAAKQSFRIHHGDTEEEILLHLQSLENALTATDSIDPISGNHLESLIDLDSWARKYLIEELFCNIDAGHASQFYYWDSIDGKVYAGPVWDYDNAILNTTQYALVANQHEIKAGIYAVWNYALYRNKSFHSYAIKLYEKEVRPLLGNLINTTIPAVSERITQASLMNEQRWPEYGKDFEEEITNIQDYLIARWEFLHDVWLGRTNYHIVRFDVGNNTNYLYYAVQDGEYLKTCPDVDESIFIGWYYENTGEPFSLKQPVTEDIAVVARWTGGDSSTQRMIQELIPILTITMLFLLLFLKSILRIKKETGKNHDKHWNETLSS